MDFDSHINGAVIAAIALINATTPGLRGSRYVDVPTGAELAKAATTALRSGSKRPVPDLSSDEGEQLRDWAGRLRAVVEHVEHGQVDHACSMLNALLRSAHALPNLARHDGEPWHLHFHGNDAGLAEGWAAAMATGLAVVLGGPARDRLGLCQASGCDRVYIDTSRNGSRRFCSTTCQNRVKSAAYRRNRKNLTVTTPSGEVCIEK